MPFPDGEDTEEGDTALGKDSMGEDSKGRSYGTGDKEGTGVKIEGSSHAEVDGTLSGCVEAKNNPNENAARSHSPEMDIELGEEDGEDAETVGERVVSDSKHCKETPNNTRAWKKRKGMVGAKGTKVDQETIAGGGGNGEANNSEESEEDGGEVDDGVTVRDILDKYLPILERGSSGTNQTEGKYGGEEVKKNQNHKLGELEESDQSPEMLEDQVDEEDLHKNKNEDVSKETVMDKEDISEEKTAYGGTEMMADGENMYKEKREYGRMVVIDKEAISAKKSHDGRIKSYCEVEARMGDAGHGGGGPGGILTNLIFGNFDSKGR